MRHLVLALLIALLPLRGWAGDAMATQMAVSAAVQQGAMTETMTGHADAPGAPAREDAAALAAGANSATADCSGHTIATDASARGCPNCVACQVCHTVALPLPLFESTLSFTACVTPHPAANSFTSADRAPGLKPPIS